MKTFQNIGPWRFLFIATLSLFIAAIFLTTNAETGNAAPKSEPETLVDLSNIDRETWKRLPIQIRMPIYETFPDEWKRTFWELKYEELKRLDWSQDELDHINAYYMLICENPLLMEQGAVSEELEDWFEVFRYNWREYGYDNFGWNNRLLYAIAVSGEEVLNTHGELKVYTPLTLGVNLWSATRSNSNGCALCSESDEGTIIPYPGVCAAYYICDAGMAIPQYCPPGLVFNPVLLVCDWPEYVFCY